MTRHILACTSSKSGKGKTSITPRALACTIALAVRRPDYWLWFWIGPHTEYDKLLEQQPAVP
jgi:hypothetical protein